MLALPGIAILWIQEHTALALTAYSLAVLSDFVDGRLARWFHVASAQGAFLDVIADIICIVSMLLLLGLRGVIPLWLFLAPLAAAAAFFLTSGRTSPRYDPIGKYYGGILFVVVGCLLCEIPDLSCTLLCFVLGALSAVVFVNRLRLATRLRMI